MEKKKIAVQLYSVRDAMEKDFYGTLKNVKAFGYDGVEFAGLFGHAPEEVKAMCRELELVPISAHVSLQQLMDDMEGTIEAYRTIGCVNSGEQREHHTKCEHESKKFLCFHSSFSISLMIFLTRRDFVHV